MKLRRDFFLYNIEDDYMLIPTGEAIASFGGTIVLNDVAAFLIEKLKENDLRYEDLVAAVLEEYEANDEQVRNDVTKAIEVLKEYDILDD